MPTLNLTYSEHWIYQSCVVDSTLSGNEPFANLSWFDWQISSWKTGPSQGNLKLTSTVVQAQYDIFTPDLSDELFNFAGF